MVQMDLQMAVDSMVVVVVVEEEEGEQVLMIVSEVDLEVQAALQRSVTNALSFISFRSPMFNDIFDCFQIRASG